MKALRAALRHRAFGRCEIPWCRTAKGPLDSHHVVRRSHGGADSLRNLLLVCRRHHEALEAGRIEIMPHCWPDGAITWALSTPRGHFGHVFSDTGVWEDLRPGHA